jgi:hypothetical protein
LKTERRGKHHKTLARPTVSAFPTQTAFFFSQIK